MGVEHSTALGYIHNSHFGIHFVPSHQHHSLSVAVPILVLGVADRDSAVQVPRRILEMSLDP